MASLGTLDFTVKLDDSTIQQQIKKLQGELNALGSKAIDVSLSGDAHKQLSAIKSSLEQINNLKDISINISNLNALQHLNGTITNLSLDQSIIDSIVKRIEMALANSKIKLSAADTIDVRKSVETALLDAVKGSSPSMAAEIANALKNGISKVKLNIDAKGIADSVENALKNKTLSVKGLTVNANDLAASIRNSLVSQHFYVTVTVKQDELIQSVNTALSKVNKIGVASQQAHGVAANAVKKHAQAYRPLSEQMNTTTQLATILGNTMGNLFSVYAVKNFLESIVKVGGELEKQKLAMSAIIGDAHDAQIIFKQVSDLSMISPFDVQDLVTYTKQLSAFGIKYDELYDTTKRLSDLAAGVGVSFGRIAYEYGQTSARGWLDGRELRMFANSGIPLLQKLSDLYTQMRGEQVTAAEVREMVTNRQVAFEDVQKVIKQMTDEGGEFYRMQEVMAESLAAKWRNLGNDWNLMMGQLAESSIGKDLKGLAETLMKVVENWKMVLSVGSVFAALLINIKVWRAEVEAGTASMKALKIETEKFSAAQKAAFGLKTTIASIADTIFSNIYVIGIAAIVALAKAFHTAKSEADEYREVISGIGNRIAIETNTSIGAFDRLIKRLGEAKNNQEEYGRIIDQINNKYGEYIGNLSREASEYEKVAEAAGKARVAIQEKIRSQIQEDAVNTVTSHRNEISKEIMTDMGKLVNEDTNDSMSKEMIYRIQNWVSSGFNADEIAKMFLAEFNVSLDKYTRREVSFGKSKLLYASSDVDRFVKNYQKEVQEIQEITENAGGYELYKNLIDPINKYYDTLKEKTTDQNKRLKIEEERYTALKTLFETGSLKTSYNGTIVAPISKIMVDKYTKELNTVKNALSKKWLEISNDIFGADYTYSSKAGGKSGTAAIFADLGALKSDNDYLSYIEKLAKKYKELTKSIKGRKTVEESKRSDTDSVRELEKEEEEVRRLDEFAKKLGFTWAEFDESQKKAKTGTTDKQLKQWKARVDAIKKFYDEYKKYYTEYSKTQNEESAKNSALNKVKGSGLFDVWNGIIDMPTSMEEYKKLLNDVYKEISAAANTDERKNLAESLSAMLNLDIPYDQLTDSITRAIDKAIADADKAIVENKARYDLLKNLFEATGEDEYRDNWMDFLEANIRKMLKGSFGDVNIMDLLGMDKNTILGMLIDGSDYDALEKLLQEYKAANDSFKEAINSDFVAYVKTYVTKAGELYAMVKKYQSDMGHASSQEERDMITASFKSMSFDKMNDIMKEAGDSLVDALLSNETKQKLVSILNDRRAYMNSDAYKKLSPAQQKEYSSVTDLFQKATGGGVSNFAELLASSKKAKEANDIYISSVQKFIDASEQYKVAVAEFGESSDEAKEALENLGSAKDDMDNAQNNANQANNNATTDYSGTITKLNSINGAVGQMGSGVDGMFNGIMKLCNVNMAGFGGVVSAIVSIVVQIVQLLDNNGERIEQMATSFGSSLNNVMKQGIIGTDEQWKAMKGSYNGIGSILSGFVDGILESLTFGFFDKWTNQGSSDKSYEKDMEALTASNDALRYSIDELSDLMDGMSIDDASNTYEKMISNIKESMANYQEQLARSGKAYSNGTLGFGGSHSSNSKINTNITAEEWKRVSDITGKSVSSASDFWNLTSEEMWNVATYASDIYGRIKSYADDGYKDASQYMDDYIELWKDLEDAYEQLFETVTGLSWDEMYDGFKDLMKDLDSTAEDFADSFEEYMFNAIINSLSAESIKPMIEQFQKDLTTAMQSDGGLSAEEVAQLQESWSSMTDTALNIREIAQEISGYEGDTDSGLSSSIKGMTEETADILAAYLNAIRADVSIDRTALESIYGQQLPQLQATADSQLVQLTQQTEYLRMIQESNASIAEEVEALQSDFSHVIAGTKKIYTA